MKVEDSIISDLDSLNQLLPAKAYKVSQEALKKIFEIAI